MMTSWILFVTVVTTTSAIPWRTLFSYGWEYRRHKELADLKAEMVELRNMVQDREFIWVEDAFGNKPEHQQPDHIQPLFIEKTATG